MSTVLLQNPSRHKLLASPQASEISLRIRPNRIQLTALLLIVASTLFSLAYVWFLCPLDLASDEAHYWDWSRHLDWCYYSKGPLVAWLIRLSCEIFGWLSVAVTGDLGAAVRLPAIFCHFAILAGSYLLARQIFHSPWTGLIVVAVEASLPIVRAGSVLMTIDPPFLACWCWALICVSKVLTAENQERSMGWWWGAAVCTALGVLAKFTMTLFPIAVLGYLVGQKRAELRRPGVWILLGGTVLGWAPILEWNARHDWASFRHVFGQIGGEQRTIAEFHPLGPVLFLGGQLGMLLCGWLVAFLAAAWRFCPLREKNREKEIREKEIREKESGIILLWWCSVPVWLLFALASFIKVGQPNWPAPAYLGGLLLAIGWLRERLNRPFGGLVRFGIVGTVAASLVLGVATHFPNTVRPFLAQLVNNPSAAKPLPIRDLDISARLVGWRTLSSEVDRLRTRLTTAEGAEPVLAGINWTIPGHLGFFCAGHPQAYALGIPNKTDRHSQYDYWRPNPVNDAQAFQGRTFVVVGEIGPEVRGGFEWIEPGLQIVHSEAGIPIAAWTIWVCHGFRGFVESRTDGHLSGY